MEPAATAEEPGVTAEEPVVTAEEPVIVQAPMEVENEGGVPEEVQNPPNQEVRNFNL